MTHYQAILAERYPTDDQIRAQREKEARELVKRVVANHKARHKEAVNRKPRKPRAKETQRRELRTHWAKLLLDYVQRDK